MDLLGTLDDADAVLSGAATAAYVWNANLADDIYGPDYDMRRLVNPVNFVTGSSGRIDIGDPLFTAGTKTALRVYDGAFQQSIDGTCFPWDRQIVKQTFQVPSHPGFETHFFLFCREHCKAFARNGTEVVVPDVLTDTASIRDVYRIVYDQTESKETKHFRWSAFTCELLSRHTIQCSMAADREAQHFLRKYLLPGIVMLLIGFGSFYIPPSLSMPRVAVSMIALLTTVTKYTTVLVEVPQGHMNWVEEYYLVTIVVMLVNVCGHIVSFWKPHAAKAADAFSIYVVFFFVWLYLLASLASRRCDRLSAGWLWTAVVFAAVSLLVSVVKLLVTYWSQITGTVRKGKGDISERVRIPSPPGLARRGRWRVWSSGSHGQQGEDQDAAWASTGRAAV